MKHKSARNGFSLLEVTIAAMMSSMVVVLASTVAVDIGRGFVEGIAEARIATEFRILTGTLQRDFAGSLPEARSGPVKQWRLVGRQLVSDTELRLCFDADEDGSVDWVDDRIITYLLDDGQLIRSDSISGTEFVVAENLSFLSFSIDAGLITTDFQFSLGGLEEPFTYVTADLP
ncbi:PulJ/GspJ family protein [Rubripirellula obstinata]|uniref:PulJ/GspJ family protein n=1 Tax=Rubripirellula obstinata TaxID=406547 RepID=UPI00135A8397|nr:hypothetical protein [Rubripirellula obstinata]